MTQAELAAEMGVTEADLTGFIACLSVWAAKGYSLEECIERHMAQMTRLASNSHRLGRQIVIDTFFPA